MNKVLLGFTLASAISFSLPVAASGFYVAADVGRSTLDIDNEEDLTWTGFSASGGYRINDMFAVELSYRDLGEEEAEEYSSEYDVEVSAKLGVTALQASVIARYPLNPALNIYGRLGIADIKVKATASAVGGGMNISESDSTSENKAVYGVGLEYSLTPAFSLRGEYSQFEKWDDVEVSTFSLGARYQF